MVDLKEVSLFNVTSNKACLKRNSYDFFLHNSRVSIEYLISNVELNIDIGFLRET
jgi:hypothetical protein